MRAFDSCECLEGVQINGLYPKTQKIMPARLYRPAVSNMASVKRCHQPKYEAGVISEQHPNPIRLEMTPLLRRDDTSNPAKLEIVVYRLAGIMK